VLSDQEELAAKKAVIEPPKFNSRVNNYSEISDRFT